MVNKKLFVLYHYDGNSIPVRPMKERSEKKFLQAFQYLQKYLRTQGLKPSYTNLDNEASLSFPPGK